jgi:hypothetical protein
MYGQSRQPGMMDDPDRPPPQGAFPIWRKVFTKPLPQTFLEITQHPDATARNAYVWVFLAGTFSGLVSGVLRFALSMTALRQAAPQLNQFPGLSAGIGFGGIVGTLCAAPLAGVFSVIGFAINTALIHWIARFLGGQSTFDKMAYSYGAITAPLTILAAIFVPFYAIPYASFCALPILLVAGLFAIYLQIAAVKGVHGFGWLEAVIAVFLPVILLGFMCAFVVLGIMKTLGPSFNDLIQGLPRQGF